MVLKIIEQVRKKSEMKDFPKVRLERFKEGRCAQILQVGPYSAEGPTIQKLHEFIKAEGYVLRGWHHEIYLGDPRRSGEVADHPPPTGAVTFSFFVAFLDFIYFRKIFSVVEFLSITLIILILTQSEPNLKIQI